LPIELIALFHCKGREAVVRRNAFGDLLRTQGVGQRRSAAANPASPKQAAPAAPLRAGQQMRIRFLVPSTGESQGRGRTMIWQS
jgi:hypothetical protein